MTADGRGMPDASAGTRPSLPRLVFDGFEELVAAGLLLIIGCSLGAQVLLRTVFAAPLGWPEELAQFLFVWASLFGAVGAMKRVSLIKVEFFAERLSATVQRGVRVVIFLLITGLLVIVGWMGWQLASRTSFGFTALPITWAWAYAAAPVFAVLAFLRLCQVEIFGYRFVFVEGESLGEAVVDTSPAASGRKV